MALRLSPFLWNNFLESSEGTRWIAFFATLKQRYLDRDRDLVAFIDQWASEGGLDYRPTADEEISPVLVALKLLREEAEQHGPMELRTWEDAESYFRDRLGELAYVPAEGESPDEPELVFEATHVPPLSVALYCNHPRFFFPYYFLPQFWKLRRIFEDLGIFLPPVPAKRDWDGRFFYYLELCRSLHAFCHQHGIKPEHLPVLLYGFAPKALELNQLLEAELPRPRKAWFVGGGIGNNGDFEYLDQVNQNSRTFWQGHVDTEPGDIVVMYCLTPRSCIHSIWRAVQAGAVEPFRYWPATIWIGQPIRVSSIGIAEIKADPVLRDMPLVRGNMQGINGRRIPKEYYDRILAILRTKGTDISLLPQLENAELPRATFKTERDIERGLLEPLLLELGFEERDWERQVIGRVGRGQRAIPDYTVLPKRNERAVTAAWVWEAKLSIPTHGELRLHLGQAASYARLLDAQGLGLVSKEGVWIATRGNDYSIEKAVHWPAAQVWQSDHLAELRDMAGKQRMQPRIN